MSPSAILIGITAVGLGVAAERVAFGLEAPHQWVPDLVVGWTYVGCGLVAADRRPGDRCGMLMVATGTTWFIGNFAADQVESVAWLAGHLSYLYRGFLVHLILTYPDGRASSRPIRVAVFAGYLASVVTPVWESETATILLSAALVTLCGREYARAIGGRRRARLQALWAAAGLGLVLAGGAVARLMLASGTVSRPSLLAFQAMLCLVAGGLLIGLVTGESERVEVTDLVVELGTDRSGTLRAALSKALGDPPRRRVLVRRGRGVRRLRWWQVPASRPGLEAGPSPMWTMTASRWPPWSMTRLYWRTPRSGCGGVGDQAGGREQSPPGRGPRPGGRSRGVPAADPRRRGTTSAGGWSAGCTTEPSNGCTRCAGVQVSEPADRGSTRASGSPGREAGPAGRGRAGPARTGIHPSVLSEQGLRRAVPSLVEHFRCRPTSTSMSTGCRRRSKRPPYSRGRRGAGQRREVRVRVEGRHICGRRRANVIVVVVEDDGVGGADPTRGSGPARPGRPGRNPRGDAPGRRGRPRDAPRRRTSRRRGR